MRVKSKSFKPCKCCGKRPIVTIINVNIGAVHCRGNLFNRHKEILYYTDYQPASKLYQNMIDGWNELQEN